MTKRLQNTIYVCDTCGIEIESPGLPLYWFNIKFESSGIQLNTPTKYDNSDWIKQLNWNESWDFCSMHCLEIFMKGYIEGIWNKACLEIEPDKIESLMKLNNRPKPFNYEINRKLLEESKVKKTTKKK